MKSIDRIESIYLQGLRIFFLIAASITLFCTFIYLCSYWANRNAKPERVSEAITLGIGPYMAQRKADETKRAQAQSAADKESDELFQKFIAINERIAGVSNARGAGRTDYARAFNRYTDPYQNLGLPFVRQLIAVLEDASNNREILERLSENYAQEMSAILGYAVGEYRHQQQLIEQKKAAAAQAAAKRQAGSVVSLTSAWTALCVFAFLILLVALLKIERTLRAISSSVPDAQGNEPADGARGFSLPIGNPLAKKPADADAPSPTENTGTLNEEKK